MNKQFEEWLHKEYNHEMYMDFNAEFVSHEIFDQLPWSMQQGVYLEFFDSVGITIYNSAPERSGEWSIMVRSKCVSGETRQRAQQEAVKKAFEILKTKQDESK